MAYGDNPGSRPVKLKRKKKPATKAPSTTDRTSPNPSPPSRPKAGPPSPQRTGGRPSRPQPVQRKRDAAPTTTDRTSDARRSPEQKRRDRAASDDAVRESRKRVIRKRSKPLTERLTISSKGTLILKGDGGPKRGRAAIPGATANALDELGSPLGPEVNRLISKRSRPEDLEAPALVALEHLSRPLHAVAGAAKEDVENFKKMGVKGLVGHGSLEEAEKGLTGETDWTFSDVLKEAGVEDKAVAGIGGFVLDMVLDPLQGAKISRLGPKQALDRMARELEARAARAAKARTVKGKTVRPARPKAAERLRKEAAKVRKAAEAAPSSRGIQAGVDFKVPFGPRVTAMTTGKATSRVGGKLAPAADKLRESRPVRAVGAAVSPTRRRAGETAAERDAYLYAERRKRAGERDARRKAQRRGTAHARAPREVDDSAIVAAVEHAAVKPLAATKMVQRKSPEHRAVATARRRLRVAETKLDKERGRAALLREQARRTGKTYSPPRRLVEAKAAAKQAKETLDLAVEVAAAAPKHVRYRVDAATGERYSDFKDRIDVYTVDDLPPDARAVGAAAERELADLKARQQDAGVLDGERDDYFPHRLTDDEAKRRRKAGGRKGRAAKTPYAKTRTDERPIAEQHYERDARGEGSLFSTDEPSVVADYTLKGENAIVDARYLKELKQASKPLTESSFATRRETDGIYEITPTGIRAVDNRTAEAVLTGDKAELHKISNPPDPNDLVVMPRSRGDAELRSRGGKDADLRNFIHMANRPVQVFKTAATVLNLGFYQIRNFMDDSFRSWAGDTPLAAFKDATVLVKDMALWERRQESRLTPEPITGTVTVAGKEVPRAEFLEQALEDGAFRTGFFAGEDVLEGSMRPASGIRRIRPVAKVRQWSQNAEDVPRLATYKGALDRGATRQEAATHMRLYHFDYDELTDIERGIRALFVPFYTYVRRNTPLQLQLLVSRPGKPAAIEKLREEFIKYGADGEDYDQEVEKLRPSLEAAVEAGIISRAEIEALEHGHFEGLLTEPDQRGFPFLGPDGSIQYMPIGITDLNRIPFATSWETLREMPRRQYELAMSLLGPQKLAIELPQNFSFFFKNAIYRSGENPEAERWVTAPGWAKKIGVPTVKQEVDGKVVDAWPSWLDYSFRALGPQAGMLATVGNPATTGRGQKFSDLALKQATGVRRAQFDDRILAGLIGKAAKELGRVAAAQADAGDVPGGKGKIDPQGHYPGGGVASKRYEALLDKERELEELIETLKTARAGHAAKEPLRIERRPKPAPSLSEKLRKQRESSSRMSISERLARERARRRVESGG